MDVTDVDDASPWAECAGCDNFAEVDGCGLCGECAKRLDRDLIRERDWEYSISAYGVPHHRREALRDEVIRHHGAALELIGPSRTRKPSWKRSRQTRRQRERDSV
jgi:hypothetical protein